MTRHSRHIQAICKLLRANEHHLDLHALFSDCMEATAIAISNSVDRRHREAREQRYLDIVGRYERAVIDSFPRLLAEIVGAFECEFGDVLGAVFGELSLHSAAKGQFFTPYTVSRFMAEVILGTRDSAASIIEQNGFIRAMEPACGAGGMVIGLADAMREANLNYQRHLHVTAVDIDPRAVHMAYIQLSLLHIPAILIVGNSLSLETRETWFTPAHILGGWSAKLARRRAEEASHSVIKSPATPPRATPSGSEPNGGPPLQLSLF